MKRCGLPLLAILFAVLLSSCDLFDPQWVGVWKDIKTVPDTIITLDFGKDFGTVRVDNNALGAVAWLTIVQGSLDGDENTLIATIRSIYQENQDNPDGQTLAGAVLFWYVTLPVNQGGLGLNGLENSVSYTIDSDTLYLNGELIYVLTQYQSYELWALRQ